MTRPKLSFRGRPFHEKKKHWKRQVAILERQQADVTSLQRRQDELAAQMGGGGSDAGVLSHRVGVLERRLDNVTSAAADGAALRQLRRRVRSIFPQLILVKNVLERFLLMASSE